MIIIISIEFIITLFLSIMNLGNFVIDYYFLELLLLFIYSSLIYYSYKQIKLKPLLILFSIVLGIFIYGRFLLDALWLMPYKVDIATRFIQYTFSNETLQTTLIIYNLATVSILLGFYAHNTFTSHISVKPLYKKNILHYFKIVGLILIIISLPGVIYKLFLTIQLILTHGYLSFYTGDETSGIDRIIEFVSYKLYLIGASFYLSSNLTRKEFKFIALIMLSISIVYLILGKRAEFGITILFLMWYWLSFIKQKPLSSIFKLAILALIIPLFIMFQYVNEARSGKELSIKNIPIEFIASQGVSGLVLPYYIDYEKKLKQEDYPYLIAPIVDRFERGDKPHQTIQKTNYFSHQLTYTIDREAFLRGEGLGASFIAELYAIGYLFVLLGSFILGYTISWLEANKNRHLVKFLSLILLMTIFFLPRGELFEYFYELLLLILVYILFIILFKSSIVKAKIPNEQN